MSSSISSHLRLFSPQLRRNLNSHKPISTIITQTPPFLSSKPLLSSSSTTITFSRLQPIKSQLQQDQTPSSDHVEPTLLPKNLQDIIALFQSVQDPKAKYHQLLHYGNKLPPLDTRYKTEEHRVRGCVSQVWVRAFADPDDPSAIRFEADSDSALTKGLAALLVMGLSGAPAPVIAQLPPEFVHLLGLRQSLTPSRNNGFLNMLKLMQQKALQLYAKDDSVAVDGVSDGKDSNLSRDTNGLGVNSLRGAAVGVNGSRDSVKYKVSETKNSNLDMNGEPVDSSLEARISSLDGSGDAPSSLLGGRGERIRERLERELSPVELEVEDISYQHAGHASVRASKDGETHFNVKIVSKEFEGKSMVKRHRLVYDLLQGELQSGLHALSIVAKTPSEVSPR